MNYRFRPTLPDPWNWMQDSQGSTSVWLMAPLPQLLNDGTFTES
jgi:hypothetical protein